jgi:NAD(P)-dependent dehydrogenase (short-subunit alcohol dehydrogenase family)
LQPGAAIIATASEQAYDPSPDLYDYAQTKAVTQNFVKSLAKQLGPKGIRVNGVAPGPIWTPLQISGGASEAKVVTFGATARSAGPGNPRNWPEFMSGSPRTTAATQRRIFMAPAAAKDSPESAADLAAQKMILDCGCGKRGSTPRALIPRATAARW